MSIHVHSSLNIITYIFGMLYLVYINGYFDLSHETMTSHTGTLKGRKQHNSYYIIILTILYSVECRYLINKIRVYSQFTITFFL